MVYSTENAGYSAVSKNKNMIALEATLQQSLGHLKDLLLDFEQLQIESQNYKDQLCMQQEKCESKVCVGSVTLKKVIEIKDNIIQSVASALTKLNETKDMHIIDEAFKILCGETAILTPPKEKQDVKPITPKKELSMSISEDLNEESLSEIDGTPGRTSPIIFSKKFKNTASSDIREKKKCPDSWPTPENKKTLKLTHQRTPPEKKTVKLTYCTPTNKPGGKTRQARFTLVKQKSVVDLTSSPELSGSPACKERVNSVQLNIKKEPIDDEDTIQPSPTSLNSNFLTMFKSARNSPIKPNKNSPKKTTKNSPGKFNKRPISKLQLQLKTENVSESNIENIEGNIEDDITRMEDSINLMRPNRFQTPVKSAKIDPEETDCEIDSSMSLLPRIKLDKISPSNKGNLNSPVKRPLLENINYTNLQTQCDTESSISLLAKNPIDTMKDLEPQKPKKDEVFKVETIFKEPTVRKKAEKRALPGWSCDECKNFYAELYANDPETLAQKMDECSKHRGRNNPVRPKTPPGFWNPRWDVPEDTEEFNRRNNAV